MTQTTDIQSWTVDEMMACGPCARYTRERVEALWAGRDRLTVLEILDLDIPAADRVWAALQGGEHVPAAVERIVARAVESHALRCGMPEVEAWARIWLSGDDRSADAACAAARAAAYDAARAAAYDAACAAACDAACAAVEAAVGAAVGAAADAADVADVAERERQVDDIRAAVVETRGN